MTTTRFAVMLGMLGVATACSHTTAPAVRSLPGQDICLSEPSGHTSLDDAIRASQAAARTLSNKPESWVLVGQGWVRKARLTADPGYFLNVTACADAASAVVPNHPHALQLRGLALMNDHRFAEAATVARQILAGLPKDTIALGVLSDALLETGDFEGAADAAQQMVNARPDMSSYSRAAYLRWLEGDADAAKLFMRYALDGRDVKDREPTAWTFVQAATIYWHEGDREGADAVFEEALRWVDDYPPALIGRARIAMASGDAARAVRYLEKAAETSRLAEAFWLLGDARELAGDVEGAREAYQALEREGQRDRLTLALYYATKNIKPQEALRLIEAERKSRAGIYVDDAYAWALYRAGRFDEARAASDRALRWGTRDARLLYHAGAIRLAQGDGTGRRLLADALKLNPMFDVTVVREARNSMGSEPIQTH